MKLSKLGQEINNAGIKIVFDALCENSRISDDYPDQEDIDRITEQYESGNDAAWFLARVKLEFDGIESDTEYLGCCSYDSFDEFTSDNNGYFDDMLLTCYKSLKAKFEIPRLELPLIKIIV